MIESCTQLSPEQTPECNLLNYDGNVKFHMDNNSINNKNNNNTDFKKNNINNDNKLYVTFFNRTCV